VNDKSLPGADEPDSLAGYLTNYLDWLRIRNYADVTIGNRRTLIGYFIIWCAERDLYAPQEITRPVIEQYQRWLFYYRKANGEPLKFRTQGQRLIPIKHFFKWLARENVILHNPASELDAPRAERRLPPTPLTAEEAEKVLAQPDIATATGLRDRAMMEVFYATGIRRAELIALHVWDVDYARAALAIRQGKGRRDRVVPLGSRALSWIVRYRDEVRSRLVTGRDLAGNDGGTLFIMRNGKCFEPKRLSERIKAYVDGAGLNKTGSCHLFRHTAATLMLEGGADTRYIQALLGHESLESTQVYTQVSLAKLAEVHGATHPGVKFKSHVSQK